MKPDNIVHAENYELNPVNSDNDTDIDSEPLLPRYERHDQSSPISQQHAARQRKHGLRRVVVFLCAGLLVLVPLAALAGCWFGRMTLDRVRTWDQLPPEWKEWLEQVKSQGGVKPDHENFPTK